MTKDNIKQAVIAICVGACVAFFTSLFDGLSNFLKQNATEAIAGGISSFSYIIKNFRA